MIKILDKIPQQQNSHSIIRFIRWIVVLVCVLVLLNLGHESNLLHIESMYVRAVIMLVAFLTIIIVFVKYPIKSLFQSDEDTQMQHLSTAQKRSRYLMASNASWLAAIFFFLLCLEPALLIFSSVTTKADVISTDAYEDSKGRERYKAEYRFYDAKSDKWYISTDEISWDTWQKLDTAEIKLLPVRYLPFKPSISGTSENDMSWVLLFFVLGTVVSVYCAVDCARKGLQDKQSNNKARRR